MFDAFTSMASIEDLCEKEYHFDEGLGQSLKEHVREIEDNFEDMDVKVRRDRDGFAIVKTKFKPKYKYDIDKIAKFDPKVEQSHFKETLEIVYKNLMPG
jgi:hypothetical protein